MQRYSSRAPEYKYGARNAHTSIKSFLISMYLHIYTCGIKEDIFSTFPASIFIFWGSTGISLHDFQLKTPHLSSTGPLCSSDVLLMDPHFNQSEAQNCSVICYEPAARLRLSGLFLPEFGLKGGNPADLGSVNRRTA